MSGNIELFSISKLGSLIIGMPLVALLMIIADRVISHRAREGVIRKIVLTSQAVSIFAATVCCAWVTVSGNPLQLLELPIISLSDRDMAITLQIDRLSVAFVLITCLLGGVVGLFASRYMHRDNGYFRFFILFHIFLVGVHLIFQGGSLPTIYVGWELIGISSALLISFFSFRRQTVSNSLRAFWAYRVTDSGILVATLLAMHEGIERFGIAESGSSHTFIVLGCLLSAIGKSAQFPFGRWLPKAMEGPTPSSAIFYGGLSVHAGMYLMLRATSAYGSNSTVNIIMIIVGLFSLWYATTVGRIQSDAKSALAYASMAQVGLMFIEIGFNLHALAVFHFTSHAMLRTYQLLNASSVMHDRYAFEHVLGRDKVSFTPVRDAKDYSRYAYAFWESIDGAFGKLSLLSGAEAIARFCRELEERICAIALLIARYTIFTIKHPARTARRSVHGLIKKEP